MVTSNPWMVLVLRYHLSIKETLYGIGVVRSILNRILKIARTIVDLEADPNLQVDHISEAIQYRNLDHGGQVK